VRQGGREGERGRVGPEVACSSVSRFTKTWIFESLLIFPPSHPYLPHRGDAGGSRGHIEEQPWRLQNALTKHLIVSRGQLKQFRLL